VERGSGEGWKITLAPDIIKCYKYGVGRSDQEREVKMAKPIEMCAECGELEASSGELCYECAGEWVHEDLDGNWHEPVIDDAGVRCGCEDAPCCGC